jgi:hypothetical protein
VKLRVELARSGVDELSVVKIGGKLRFDRADLQKFIDDHRRPGRAS